MLAYEDKIPFNRQEFTEKVNAIATALKTNPNWLMAVMYNESKLQADAENLRYPLHNGPATGLIQFTPDTAISLGTTVGQLKLMDNITQLDYVKKYFDKYKGQLKSYYDVYAAVFFPAAIGKPDTWTFETKKLKRTAIAAQNPSIDINKDGSITVAEFKQYLYNTITATWKNLVFTVEQTAKAAVQAAKNNPGATALIAIIIFFLIRKK